MKLPYLRSEFLTEAPLGTISYRNGDGELDGGCGKLDSSKLPSFIFIYVFIYFYHLGM
jgi:hypothetical protein